MEQNKVSYVKRKNQNKSPSYMVGAFVPQEISSCITVYGLANGISKSAVLNDLLKDWYRKIWLNPAERECLVKELLFLVQHDWNLMKARRKPENVSKCFVIYLEGVRKDLLSRHILTEVVEEIISEIKI